MSRLSTHEQVLGNGSDSHPQNPFAKERWAGRQLGCRRKPLSRYCCVQTSSCLSGGDFCTDSRARQGYYYHRCNCKAKCLLAAGWHAWPISGRWRRQEVRAERTTSPFLSRDPQIVARLLVTLLQIEGN